MLVRPRLVCISARANPDIHQRFKHQHPHHTRRDRHPHRRLRRHPHARCRWKQVVQRSQPYQHPGRERIHHTPNHPPDPRVRAHAPRDRPRHPPPPTLPKNRTPRVSIHVSSSSSSGTTPAPIAIVPHARGTANASTSAATPPICVVGRTYHSVIPLPNHERNIAHDPTVMIVARAMCITSSHLVRSSTASRRAPNVSRRRTTVSNAVRTYVRTDAPRCHAVPTLRSGIDSATAIPHSGHTGSPSSPPSGYPHRSHSNPAPSCNASPIPSQYVLAMRMASSLCTTPLLLQSSSPVLSFSLPSTRKIVYPSAHR